jgi:hypothetical protein
MDAARAAPDRLLTKRLAEDWLRDLLVSARRGTLAGQAVTGATFADAAAEWLRYVEFDRQRKPSTLEGYGSTAGYGSARGAAAAHRRAVG